MKNKIFLKFFFLLLLVPINSNFAYGPIAVNPQGQPIKWQKFPLVYNPENGPFKGPALCGGSSPNQNVANGGGGGCELTPSLKEAFFNNLEGISMIDTAFFIWKNIEGTEFDFTRGSKLDDGGDVNVCNFEKFFVLQEPSPSDSRICGCIGACKESCLNPIIFDSDGSITDTLFGVGAKNRIVGFAGPVLVRGIPYIPKMEALFNAYCVDPAGEGCPIRGFNDQEVQSVILHELGHAIGLDHTQVNPQLIDEIKMKGEISPERREGIPTMYPILIEGVNMLTLHADDIQSLRYLYGTQSFPNSSSCSLEGDVVCIGCQLSLQGDPAQPNFQISSAMNNLPLSCVEVVAEASSLDQSLSAMSGAEVANNPLSFIPANTSSVSYDSPLDCLNGEDKSRCGHFRIDGLQAGQTYSIVIHALASNLRKGSSVNPCYYPLSGFKENFGTTVTCTANTVHQLGEIHTSPK